MLNRILLMKLINKPQRNKHSLWETQGPGLPSVSLIPIIFTILQDIKFETICLQLKRAFLILTE